MDLIEIIVILALVGWYFILFLLLRNVRDLEIRHITLEGRIYKLNEALERRQSNLNKLMWDED